jgi:hypothetical protein
MSSNSRILYNSLKKEFNSSNPDLKKCGDYLAKLKVSTEYLLLLTF